MSEVKSQCVSQSIVADSLQPHGSAVHQARVLEWVTMPFSRRSSQLRDWTRVFCVAGRLFTIWATGKGPDECLTTIYIWAVMGLGWAYYADEHEELESENSPKEL